MSHQKTTLTDKQKQQKAKAEACTATTTQVLVTIQLWQGKLFGNEGFSFKDRASSLSLFTEEAGCS